MARVLFTLVLIMTACVPSVHYFRAQPNVVCSGGQSSLIWSASTSGTITNAETGALVVRAAKEGSTVVSPPSHTTYRLSARSVFGTTRRDVDVSVVVIGEPRELGVSMADSSARCENGVVAAVVHADPNAWDAHIVASTIHALGHRPLRVEHDGVAVDVAADGQTDAFRSVPVRGDWSVSSPLQQGEQCGVRGPRNLAIQIIPSCSP